MITFRGVGIYHGSKFALEGISETLGKEVKEFGILVTAIEPGMFRTDWAGRAMARVPRTIADYDSGLSVERLTLNEISVKSAATERASGGICWTQFALFDRKTGLFYKNESRHSVLFTFIFPKISPRVPN